MVAVLVAVVSQVVSFSGSLAKVQDWNSRCGQKLSLLVDSFSRPQRVFSSHFENDCSQNEIDPKLVTLWYATTFSIAVNHERMQDRKGKNATVGRLQNVKNWTDTLKSRIECTGNFAVPKLIVKIGSFLGSFTDLLQQCGFGGLCRSSRRTRRGHLYKGDAYGWGAGP